jgi:hypothetical protein
MRLSSSLLTGLNDTKVPMARVVCHGLGMRNDVEVRLRPGDRERLEAVLADRNSPQKHVESRSDLAENAGQQAPGTRSRQRRCYTVSFFAHLGWAGISDRTVWEGPEAVLCRIADQSDHLGKRNRK